MEKMSDYIQQAVESCLDDIYRLGYDTPAAIDELITFGELVDRLAITNIKLYNLKDQVVNSSDDFEKARLADKDVVLCKERSLLKKAIDDKIIQYIHDFVANGKVNKITEQKQYGKNT